MSAAVWFPVRMCSTVNVMHSQKMFLDMSLDVVHQIIFISFLGIFAVFFLLFLRMCCFSLFQFLLSEIIIIYMSIINMLFIIYKKPSMQILLLSSAQCCAAVPTLANIVPRYFKGTFTLVLIVYKDNV